MRPEDCASGRRAGESYPASYRATICRADDRRARRGSGCTATALTGDCLADGRASSGSSAGMTRDRHTPDSARPARITLAQWLEADGVDPGAHSARYRAPSAGWLSDPMYGRPSPKNLQFDSVTTSPRRICIKLGDPLDPLQSVALAIRIETGNLLRHPLSHRPRAGIGYHRSVGGLRSADPALSFAKLRLDKNQVQHLGSTFRTGSLQSLCRDSPGVPPCVVCRPSTEVGMRELRRLCPLFAERAQEGGNQTGLSRTW